MNPNLQFDFLVDKGNNTITVKREFAAPRQLVWDCYTKSEYLDRWFAPKPFTTKTKEMDFREGGHWLYAMVDPGGAEYWGRMDYITINPIDYYKALDGFCNASGNLNPDLPRATWDASFIDRGDKSMVETLVTYNSLSDLEKVIAMGLQQGLTMTLESLDDLLQQLNK